MEKILIILLIFGFLLGTMGDDISFRDFDPEDVEVEENKITGNQKIQDNKTGNDDLIKVYKEAISGNATIDLSSEKGDIYLLFEEKITGNVKINVKSNRGDIHLKFEEAILGNPSINLEALRGKVIFYNEVETVGNAKVTVNAENVEYKSGKPKAMKNY